MSLLVALNKDFRASRLAKDETGKSALETVKALITSAQKAPGRNNEPLNDEEIIAVIRKAVKQYAESKDAFEKAERFDKAAQIQREMDVLTVYLPRLYTEAEITERLVPLLVEAKGNVGKLMGLFNKNSPQKADNALVKQLAEGLIS